jgi:hypothetical protein
MAAVYDTTIWLDPPAGTRGRLTAMRNADPNTGSSVCATGARRGASARATHRRASAPLPVPRR